MSSPEPTLGDAQADLYSALGQCNAQLLSLSEWTLDIKQKQKEIDEKYK